MIRSLTVCTRALAFGVVLLGGAFTLGYTPRTALAQETKCYLMVCTGTTCVATQIKCPDDPKKPAPPPE